MMNGFIEDIRPPSELRPKLDIGWRLEKSSVFIFEIRPDWNDPSVTLHFDFAKATWVKAQNHWKVFRMLSNQQWCIYKPLSTVGNLPRFLIEVDKDPHHCFKG